jgi:hypothetical protein
MNIPINALKNLNLLRIKISFLLVTIPQRRLSLQLTGPTCTHSRSSTLNAFLIPITLDSGHFELGICVSDMKPIHVFTF